jgi:D-alanyl-D-alanine dipeptidase
MNEWYRLLCRQVQLHHGAFDWLMSSTKPRAPVTITDSNDDGSRDDTTTEATSVIVEDPALQQTMASISSSNISGEPIWTTQLVSQAEQDALRQHVQQIHAAEVAAQRLDVTPVR